MSSPALIEIRDLTKTYLQGEIKVTALNSVSVDIAPGEFLGGNARGDAGDQARGSEVAGGAHHRVEGRLAHFCGGVQERPGAFGRRDLA